MPGVRAVVDPREHDAGRRPEGASGAGERDEGGQPADGVGVAGVEPVQRAALDHEAPVRCDGGDRRAGSAAARARTRRPSLSMPSSLVTRQRTQGFSGGRPRRCPSSTGVARALSSPGVTLRSPAGGDALRARSSPKGSFHCGRRDRGGSSPGAPSRSPPQRPQLDEARRPLDLPAVAGGQAPPRHVQGSGGSPEAQRGGEVVTPWPGRRPGRRSSSRPPPGGPPPPSEAARARQRRRRSRPERAPPLG